VLICAGSLAGCLYFLLSGGADGAGALGADGMTYANNNLRDYIVSLSLALFCLIALLARGLILTERTRRMNEAREASRRRNDPQPEEGNGDKVHNIDAFIPFRIVTSSSKVKNIHFPLEGRGQNWN